MRYLKIIFIGCIIYLLMTNIVILIIKKEHVNFEISSEMCLLTQWNKDIQYTIITDNTMNCDLATVSNIVLSLKEEGYTMSFESYSNDTLDVILTKENIAYRLFYKKDGSLTSICNEYEKSYIPFTYINER